MKKVDTIMGPFDVAKRERLRQAYETAVANKQTAFKFDGHDFDTAFTKYLIQYLDTELPKA